MYLPAQRTDALPDAILLLNLSLRGTLGLDSWERSKTQPILINLKIHSDTRAAGQSDLVGETVNYGSVAKAIEKLVAERCAVSMTAPATSGVLGSRFTTVEELAEGIAKVVLFNCGAGSLEVRVEKPRALLHAASAGVEIRRNVFDYTEPDLASALKMKMIDDYVFVKNLRLSGIIGVNPWEREEKQALVITFGVYPFVQIDTEGRASGQETGRPKTRRKGTLSIPEAQNFRVLTRLVTETVESTAYKTVEALASHIARACIVKGGAGRVKVRISKPSAIVFAEGAGVEIERHARDYMTEGSNPVPEITHAPLERSAVNGLANGHAALASEDVDGTGLRPRTYYLGLGSNLGDRSRNLQEAIRQLVSTTGATLISTSHLYESEPMYLETQGSFLNAVIALRTALDPPKLLIAAKGVEKALGRVKTIDNGPRPIDIDLLVLEDERQGKAWQTVCGDLIMPHPRMQEREFVLRPLLEVLPRDNPLYETYRSTMESLCATRGQTLRQIVAWLHRPPPRGNADTVSDARVWSIGARTYIMGILNVTPDSFSDGGDTLDANAALEATVQMVAEGADLIDIGGQSTRPNASEVSAEEEIRRIDPVIRAIRADARTRPVLLSIDTYHASVARCALDLGVNMVNDVSGGTRDRAMFDVVAEYGSPICIMHSRGTSKTMTKMTDYHNDLIQQVGDWLRERAEAAMRAGIPRWNIILDPGIGFAKTGPQNLELLRHLRALLPVPSPAPGPNGTASGRRLAGRYPLLLGTSRKTFIGTLTDRPEPKERVMGTAATLVAGIQTGVVDIVRVHDVKEMKEVALIADAIYRPE